MLLKEAALIFVVVILFVAMIDGLIGWWKNIKEWRNQRPRKLNLFEQWIRLHEFTPGIIERSAIDGFDELKPIVESFGKRLQNFFDTEHGEFKNYFTTRVIADIEKFLSNEARFSWYVLKDNSIFWIDTDWLEEIRKLLPESCSLWVEDNKLMMDWPGTKKPFSIGIYDILYHMEEYVEEKIAEIG